MEDCFGFVGPPISSHFFPYFRLSAANWADCLKQEDGSSTKHPSHSFDEDEQEEILDLAKEKRKLEFKVWSLGLLGYLITDDAPNSKGNMDSTKEKKKNSEDDFDDEIFPMKKVKQTHSRILKKSEVTCYLLLRIQTHKYKIYKMYCMMGVFCDFVHADALKYVMGRTVHHKQKYCKDTKLYVKKTSKEDCKYYYMKNMNPFRGRFLYDFIEDKRYKNVCILAEDRNIDGETLSHISKYLLLSGCQNVINTFDGSDPGGFEVSNLEKHILSCDCIIFILTLSAMTDEMRFGINLAIDICLGRCDILSIVDSIESIENIPSLLKPFPIFLAFCNKKAIFVELTNNEKYCAHEKKYGNTAIQDFNLPTSDKRLNWIRNKNTKLLHKMVNTLDRCFSVPFMEILILNNKAFENGATCKLKIRIISEDTNKADVIKDIILQKLPSADVVVNDDDVSDGKLQVLEFAEKLPGDDVIIVIPSQERFSVIYNYTLYFISNTLNRNIHMLF